MEIEIRRLKQELLDDYLYFFDNTAFTDHKEWSRCYCIHFHTYEEMNDEYKAYSSTGKTDFTRVKVSQFIRNGMIQGYLAYIDGQVVGWVNANDKKNYTSLKNNVNPGLWTDDEDCNVKSIVCFLVSPDMRRKGISTKLLERVCADAREDNYDFIEAYPPIGECDMYVAHHGTVELYKKCGFTIHTQLNQSCIMRKYLANN